MAGDSEEEMAMLCGREAEADEEGETGGRAKPAGTPVDFLASFRGLVEIEAPTVRLACAGSAGTDPLCVVEVLATIPGWGCIDVRTVGETVTLFCREGDTAHVAARALLAAVLTASSSSCGPGSKVSSIASPSSNSL